MADKQISDLTAATSITDGSLFVIEQSSAAKKATWALLKNYISPGVASVYSNSKTYNAGDYVIYNNALYRCTTAITTAESWTAAHWTAVTLADDVSGIRNDVDWVMDEIEPMPQNLINEAFLLKASGWTESGGVYTGTGSGLNGSFSASKGGFPVEFNWKPNTKYTIKFSAQDTTTGYTTDGLSIKFQYTDSTGDILRVPRSTASMSEFSMSSDPTKTVSMLVLSYANGGTDVWNIKDLCLVEGYDAFYAPYKLTAVDSVARDDAESLKNQLDGTPADIVSGLTVKSGNGFNYVNRRFPAGIYTVSLKVQSDSTSPFAAVQFCSSANYSVGNVIKTQYINRGRKVMFTAKLTSDANSLWVFAGISASASTGASLTLTDFAVYEGIYLPSGTAFDVTDVINFALSEKGKCTLGKGEYSVNNLLMPVSSTLEGCGGSVVSVLDRTYMYTMPSARSTATVGYVLPFKYTADNASMKIRAGLYKVTVNVSTTYTGTSKSRVSFIDQETYSGSHVIATADVGRGEDVSFIVFLEKGLGSVFVFAGTSVTYSEDTPVTVNSFTMELLQTAVNMQQNTTIKGVEFKGASSAITVASTLGDHFGVVWAAPSAQNGVVTDCRFHDFDGAAILLQDTGTPVDHAVVVSDSYIWNNNRGIFCKKDSEFNRYDNCIVTHNYYGFVIRGGNNYLSNCGIDGNVLGVSVDSDEGSNGGHGSISNCSMNHSDSNTGYGLVIKGTGLELVENCNFYFSKVRMENTEGNVLSNCGFGRNTGVEITGGNCNIVQGCMFKSDSDGDITIYNNTKYKVTNCYYRNGDDVTPVISNSAI